MKKIPTLFLRGEDHIVTMEVNPEAQWVIDGEGVATRKWDGTACMVEDGKLFKRYTWRTKNNHDPSQRPPDEFIQTGPFDPERGKVEGWIPVRDTMKEDRWHREAFKEDAHFPDATYELIGPKIQGNPEGAPQHILVQHGACILQPQPPRLWSLLNSYFFALAMQGISIEGIVWHHEDGRMVKIKGKDFGIRRSR